MSKTTSFLLLSPNTLKAFPHCETTPERFLANVIAPSSFRHAAGELCRGHAIQGIRVIRSDEIV